MRTYAVPARVAFVVPESGGPHVFLMHLPDGPPLVLTDSAAVIWLLAADGEVDVAQAVSEVVGRSRQEVAVEVDAYLAGLVARGLLAAPAD